MNAIALASVLALTCQETHTLEVRAVKGDAFTRKVVQSNQGRLTFKLGGNEQVQEVDDKMVRSYEEEVLKVEGHEPTSIRRKFIELSKEARVGTSGISEKKRFALEGRTIVIRKKGDETAIEGAEGIPPSEVVWNRLRQDPLVGILPEGPVAVGHEWKLAADRFKDVLGARENPLFFKSVRLTARFDKVEEKDGEPAALIIISGKASGHPKTQNTMNIEIKLETRVHLGLKTGRVLGLTSSGTSDVSGYFLQEGEKVHLSGQTVLKVVAGSEYK